MGIVIPTGVSQVAGFVAAIIEAFGFIFACEYCEMINCVPKGNVKGIWRYEVPLRNKFSCLPSEYLENSTVYACRPLIKQKIWRKR